MTNSPEPHQHNFIYRGLSYKHGHGLSGTGAKARFYAHVYFCTSCLEKQFETIKTSETSYQEARTGATQSDDVPESGYINDRW